MDFDVGTGDEVIESEEPALRQLVAMGYKYVAKAELNKTRRDFRETLLYDRLEAAVRRLNPELDEDGIRDALVQIGEDSYPHNLNAVETNEKIRAKMVELSMSRGLDPIVVTQNTGSGLSNKVVRLFDFEDPQNNDFLVTNQFRLNGFKYHIQPDIVIFVNGIPLVVIECKSPAIPDPIGEAVERKNFNKYQQKGRGYERLFFYNHCLIATCGILAKVGAISSTVDYFARWAKPYPMTEADVEILCGRKPREQEILIAGLLSKKNLLEHLQNFVLYDTKGGKRIKMIARHQQFSAVTQCAGRLTKEAESMGGVIWHTQGSGKSFSMLWFATQLMYKFDNPSILVITDRRQLDKQIHDTFKKCGFPDPIKAKSAKHLSKLLKNPRGKTIMTTIDKFATQTNSFTKERVVCLVDEAHRSHFKIKAERMRVTMPNAIFYAFTGTPITKTEQLDTYRIFGPLLDKYGFQESQADGATLPIMYQGRMPQLYVEGGDTVDEVFERVFSDMEPELKNKLKKQYVTKEAIAEAPSRIRRIVVDLVRHYTQHIEPNGYKAMIVVPSKEAAVTYKRELDSINAPASKIIMTSSLGERGKDGEEWDEYHIPPEQREHEADKFKSPDDLTKILIVVNMLLVGYDVPICQVLYLDRRIKEHNLLQAIARVNRPYNDVKKYGLIVDYSGVTMELQKALETFEDQDVSGALTPLDELLPILHHVHAEAMAFFVGVDLSKSEQIIEHFESAHKRDSFEYTFKNLSSALDSVLPGKEADPYMADFKSMSRARQIIRTYYGGAGHNILQYAAKIQQLIDIHVRSLGVSELINPMEITRENFLVFVKKVAPQSRRAQAALIKNKAIQVIKELVPNNQIYYEKLYEKLQKIIRDEAERRQNNANYFTGPEVFEEIYKEVLAEEEEQKKVFGDYEATQFEFSLYSRLNQTKDRKKSIYLTKEIFAKIKPLASIVDYKKNSSVEKRIKQIVYETLKSDMEYEQILDIMEETIMLTRNRL